MNPERVRSRYDVEVQLGERFFLTLFQAAFDAGIIPREVPFETVTFQLDRPIGATLATEATPRLMIELPASGPGIPRRDATITLALGLSVAGGCLSLVQTYVALDDATLMMVPPAYRPAVEAALADLVNRSYVIACGISDYAGALGQGRAEVRVLSAADGFARSLGVFFNLKLKVQPPPEAAERRDIRRGNARSARTFLPSGRMFAIGIGEATFPRLAADDWHQRAAKGLSEGLPTLLVDGDAAGHFDSIELLPLQGKVRVTTLATYTPSVPDASVTTEFEVTPFLDAFRVKAEVKLTRFDADTGLLGDLLGALGGGLAGALLGGFGGATFGAVGGVIIWESAEEVLEGGAEENAEDEGMLLETFFDILPTEFPIGLGPGGPTHRLSHSAAFLYGDARVTEKGMTFTGIVAPTSEPAIVAIPLTLVAAVAGSGADSRFGVETLIYRDASGAQIPVSSASAIALRSEGRLVRAGLRPVARRRRNSRIVALRFDSGLELTVVAAAGFQRADVIRVFGCQLIAPRNGPPYFRDSPDSDPDDNLERLPSF